MKKKKAVKKVNVVKDVLRKISTKKLSPCNPWRLKFSTHETAITKAAIFEALLIGCTVDNLKEIYRQLGKAGTGASPALSQFKLLSVERHNIVHAVGKHSRTALYALSRGENNNGQEVFQLGFRNKDGKSIFLSTETSVSLIEKHGARIIPNAPTSARKAEAAERKAARKAVSAEKQAAAAAEKARKGDERVVKLLKTVSLDTLFPSEYAEVIARRAGVSEKQAREYLEKKGILKSAEKTEPQAVEKTEPELIKSEEAQVEKIEA